MSIVGWTVILVAVVFLKSSVLKEFPLEPALTVRVGK